MRMTTGLVAAALVAAAAAAQDDDSVEITTTDLGGGVHMLEGQGGNIGISVGPDGVFMIDDQFAPLTPLIEEAVAGLTDSPVRFIVNTHYHGDHTGANEVWAGEGATIFAHDNVRERLMTEQVSGISGDVNPPRPPEAWPVVTFADSVTFHMNGQTVRVLHAPNAHTDGDVVVRFEEADVVHMGDAMFSGSFPYIDANAGGSLDGAVAAQEMVLEMIGADTKIIPGHGPLSTRADLEDSIAMLKGVRDVFRGLAAEGVSVEDAIAAAPLADFAEWGGGFVTEERMIRFAYPAYLDAADAE